MTPEFFRQLVSAWQPAEWGMCSLQGGFSQLKIPFPATEHEYRRDIYELCCRMHQIRVREVGISQIGTIYVNAWEEFGPEIYREFQNMVFGEICNND